MSHLVSSIVHTHHAILIGVGVSVDRTASLDADLDGSRDRSLQGAVADIDAVEEYFKHEAHVKITRLTATRSQEATGTGTPIESSFSLPTYDNVIRVLQEVIEEGAKKQTKHVYIHFSGHGTRRPDNGQLALVLYDPSTRGERYLYGDVLAGALALMANRGMSITLILDCCFSGSVRRTDEQYPASIRFSEYDSEIGEKSVMGSPFPQAASDNTRDSRLHVDRLLSSQGYAAITACSPHELASEIRFSSGNRRGALSYFLDQSLRRLRRVGTQITFPTLYRHLQTTFHANYPQQNPMRYGNANVPFFQDLSKGSNSSFYSIFRNSNNGLILNAGEAHGVHERDEYGAYPFVASESAEGILTHQQLIKLKVHSLDVFQSHLIVLDFSNENEFLGKPKWFTWKAVPLTTFSPNKPRIRLMMTLSDLDREKLEQGLNGHPFLEVCADEDKTNTSRFSVHLDDDGTYQVQNSMSDSIKQVKNILADKDEPLPVLVDILGHLATFMFFEGIEHHNPRGFEKSFSLDVNGELGPDGRYVIKHGTDWNLKITNKDERPLYFTIFNLRPSWEVQNVLAEAGEGELYVVYPQSYEELSLEMNVPDFLQSSGENEALDIMKVFVTSRPISFPAMALPPLGSKKTRDSLDGISKLVNSLENDFLRHGDKLEVPEDGWATSNYLIKTTRSG